MSSDPPSYTAGSRALVNSLSLSKTPCPIISSIPWPSFIKIHVHPIISHSLFLVQPSTHCSSATVKWSYSRTSEKSCWMDVPYLIYLISPIFGTIHHSLLETLISFDFLGIILFLLSSYLADAPSHFHSYDIYIIRHSFASCVLNVNHSWAPASALLTTLSLGDLILKTFS